MFKNTCIKVFNKIVGKDLCPINVKVIILTLRPQGLMGKIDKYPIFELFSNIFFEPIFKHILCPPIKPILQDRDIKDQGIKTFLASTQKWQRSALYINATSLLPPKLCVELRPQKG